MGQVMKFPPSFCHRAQHEHACTRAQTPCSRRVQKQHKRRTNEQDFLALRRGVSLVVDHAFCSQPQARSFADIMH